VASSSSSKGNFSVADLAYAAGFFDGEGAVSIVPVRNSGGRRSRNYKCVVLITQTDRPILEQVAAQFCGAIYSNNFKARPATWRPGYQLHIGGEDARTFLLQIRPYLRLKAALTDNALAFFELKRGLGGKRTPPDVMARMAELHAIHHALITRGRIDPVEVPVLPASPQLEMLA